MHHGTCMEVRRQLRGVGSLRNGSQVTGLGVRDHYPLVPLKNFYSSLEETAGPLDPVI